MMRAIDVEIENPGLRPVGLFAPDCHFWQFRPTVFRSSIARRGDVRRSVLPGNQCLVCLGDGESLVTDNHCDFDSDQGEFYEFEE